MATSNPDAECLRRFVTCGDEAAFAAVVGRHVGMVHGAAIRVLADPDAAQDVAQSVFILLAQRAWRLTGHPSLAGWLYRTAVLEAREYRRSHLRRLQRERAAVAIGSTMNHEESSLAELQPELDEAMLELRASDREALVLRYFGGKSVREVAAALGIREDAAQKRLCKALDALTRCFRRRGVRISAPALAVLALQQAAFSAAAVPAGLAVSVTHAAAAAVPALSFSTITITAAKLMSLTKTQITIACAVVTLTPLGYEWQAAAAAKSENRQLGIELSGLRRAAIESEKRRLETERQIGSLQRALASKAPEPTSAEQRTSVVPATWDQNSAYVRLPREVLAKVKFTEFGSAIAPDGKLDRFALPVLDADGTPRPALEAALGLSPGEVAQFRQVCRDAFTEFHARIAQHSTTSKPQVQNREAVRVDFTAFPEEGAEFQQRFRNRLTTMLGQERADAFWQQAEPVFRDAFNSFGADAGTFQLMRSPEGAVEFLRQTPQGSRIGKIEGLRGIPIPKALRQVASEWARAASKQAGGAR